MLAHCLRSGRHVEAALREYERRRIPRTTQIVRDSWRSGRMFQVDQRTLESLRNWFLGSALGKRLSMRMFREILTYPVPKL